MREAFVANGHDALSCDLRSTEIKGNHYQGNVCDILNSENWDLMIAHPPCTYLTNAGVRWLYNKDGSINIQRWQNMTEAIEFFNILLNANIPKIAIENPIQHGYASNLIGRVVDGNFIKIPYTQIIHPWQFGHGETKPTCLWLKDLPELQPTNIVEGREHKIHTMAPSPDREKNRSRTYLGIAKAMADQWNF